MRYETSKVTGVTYGISQSGLCGDLEWNVTDEQSLYYGPLNIIYCTEKWYSETKGITESVLL